MNYIICVLIHSTKNCQCGYISKFCMCMLQFENFVENVELIGTSLQDRERVKFLELSFLTTVSPENDFISTFQFVNSLPLSLSPSLPSLLKEFMHLISSSCSPPNNTSFLHYLSQFVRSMFYKCTQCTYST